MDTRIGSHTWSDSFSSLSFGTTVASRVHSMKEMVSSSHTLSDSALLSTGSAVGSGIKTCLGSGPVVVAGLSLCSTGGVAVDEWLWALVMSNPSHSQMVKGDPHWTSTQSTNSWNVPWGQSPARQKKHSEKHTQAGVIIVDEMKQVYEVLCVFLEGTTPLLKDEDLYCR